MPQNSNFRLLIDFSEKMEVTVMAPNHGGDPLGSILGHMGSQWVKKMGQNRKNYHAPNSNFRLPCGHRFFWKNGSYGYGAKSRWGSPGSILGPMGPIGSKKWVKTVKISMPPNSNFWLPRGHRFFWKNGSYGYGAKSQWGPSGSILGPMSLQSSIFRKKWNFRLCRQITVGTPMGPSWGQWGPIGSKKWV